MIRVLVVDDSATVRARLVEILGGAADFTVVGEASDGQGAVDLTAALRPDVVTLDLALPEMNGLAATEQIMAHHPTPILIVSASFNRGELFDTYEALAAGAVDVLEKPGDGDDDWEQRFLSAVRMVAKIRVITHPRARLAGYGRGTVRTIPPPAVGASRRPELIALGASTGGPAALADVIAAIPHGVLTPIVVVLHIGAPFAIAFADWLSERTARRMRVVADGDLIEAQTGQLWFAPPDRHLVIEGHRLRLHSGPERHHCRPSIDVLFESIATSYADRAVACLLTGMGRDGAAGLLAIRRAGGSTIAQDETTSIVYGMPREAAILGAAQQVLPLQEIGQAIARLTEVPEVAR